MEFIVSRNSLLRALQHVRCAITKQEIQVFKNFVFSFESEMISLRIGMKAVNVSQTLKVLSTEKVTFLFLDQSRAVLIQPQPQPDNEEITMLLMPMLCND